MAENRSWEVYQATYRANEMKILADWILTGESGSVVGLVGCGRSNLLGFLCYRPEVLQTYLPAQARKVAVIPVDPNDLPANNVSTLYRLLLRSFYRVHDHFDPTLQQAVVNLYQENRAERDPFLIQSTLHDLLLLFQTQQVQVVLVLNRFDHFCQQATPLMIKSLKSLRDNFKDTLCYIVGMRQEVAYLPDPAALGDMYDILDSHVCWVGAMCEADARHLIVRATCVTPHQLTEAEVTTLLTLTGNFPAVLRVACHWWLTRSERLPITAWETALLTERSIQYRLARMWEGLTQEEQLALSEVQKLHAQAGGKQAGGNKKLDQAFQGLAKQHEYALLRLQAKGLCAQAGSGWRVVSDLLATYIANVEGRGRGKIWLDEHGQVYQGSVLLELTDLERIVLSFFIQHAKARHTKTELIINTWPDELRKRGVGDHSLYQLIMSLRHKIEPNPANPCYLINWRGRPEGGYQFFPEGRPG